ncbi:MULTISPECIES: hypothetical protein [Clostridia]|uniref:hypothetical protein n=1 Tax=Clostridium sp. 1xD42-85 TaxID=2320084 RepID=UPI0026CEB94E
MNIVGKLLEDPTNSNFKIEPLIHGSMKGKISDLKFAIDGFITPEQARKLSVIKQHYENLKACKADLEKLILSLAEPYTEEISLILTVPSFKNTFSSIAVVSEIGVHYGSVPDS